MKQANKTLSKKREAILARSEKLDPNNSDCQQELHLKKKGKKLVRDDGFEHRTSKDNTDPLPGI